MSRRAGATLTWLRRSLALGVLLGTAACLSGPSGGSGASARTAPGRTFAPYVEITEPGPSLATIAAASGQRRFTLAFVLASGGACRPAWGGRVAIADAGIRRSVQALRRLHGSVTVSSGGADGRYLEDACPSAQALTGAYGQALDAVWSNSLDVDVETPIRPALVNAALARLQKDRHTSVRYTVRVDERGLAAEALPVLEDAKRQGVRATVNLMTMNFGAGGDWGRAMVAAARTARRQLASIWTGRSGTELGRMIGVTPMIGVNDTGAVTSLADARTLLGYARSDGLGFLSFWSTGRDNNGCPDGAVSNRCSGIAQSPYAFTKLFRTHAG